MELRRVALNLLIFLCHCVIVHCDVTAFSNHSTSTYIWPGCSYTWLTFIQWEWIGSRGECCVHNLLAFCCLNRTGRGGNCFGILLAKCCLDIFYAVVSQWLDSAHSKAPTADPQTYFCRCVCCRCFGGRSSTFSAKPCWKSLVAAVTLNEWFIL